MGKFTAQDDPRVDQTIEAHLSLIVQAILARLKPDSIILRGSFGRGEGSVTCNDSGVTFLSDYEIDVAMHSSRHRNLFVELSREFTNQLGVETGIRWVKPDYMWKRRIGPFPAGAAPVTIALYEIRYGSQILHGQDILSTAPAIEPANIPLSSAIHLLLNRMAESLNYLPHPGEDRLDDWKTLYWLNKLVLASVESLLISWKQYHFLYQERGRRFSSIAPDHLGFLGEDEPTLMNLATQATEFKLRPDRELYPPSIPWLCSKVVAIYEKVFRHLISQELGVEVDHQYTGYSARYLEHEGNRLKPFSYQFVFSKLLDMYKFLRKGRLPRNLLSVNTTSQVIYSVVPPLFKSYSDLDPSQSGVMTGVRNQMMKVSEVKPPAASYRDELLNLRNLMFSMWKNFCY